MCHRRRIVRIGAESPKANARRPWIFSSQVLEMLKLMRCAPSTTRESCHGDLFCALAFCSMSPVGEGGYGICVISRCAQRPRRGAGAGRGTQGAVTEPPAVQVTASSFIQWSRLALTFGAGPLAHRRFDRCIARHTSPTWRRPWRSATRGLGDSPADSRLRTRAASLGTAA